jgi:hypothetical protein
MWVTKEEYKRMMEICENPSPPTEKLKEIFKEYKRMIANGELLVDEDTTWMKDFSC